MRITPNLLFCFIWLLFIKADVLIGQYNLVPNPSFEIFDTCPTNGNQLYRTINWINPIFNSTPDYLNMCNAFGWGVPSNIYGDEPAHSGVAYSSIITGGINPSNPIFNNYREYMETELMDSLKGNVI